MFRFGLAFGLLGLIVAGFCPAAVIRGPYLQKGTPTSVVVRWRTDVNADSRVQYGTNVNELNLVALEGEATSEHEVLLTGLSPNTRYYYWIGSSTEIPTSDSDFFFVTSPDGPKPTRIWVLGDSGTADDRPAAVRDAYENFAGSRHTDIWMMLGDNAYGSGTDEQYSDAVFSMYPEMLRKSVLWPTIGNHDTYANPQNPPYLSIFSLPANGEAGGVPSGTERYYAFDHGNIHFVCLDSMSSDRSAAGPMATWLEQDLLAHTSDWLIAFWHHPPYSKGSHDSDWEEELIDMRENFLPILESHGVDLVLCGHSHSYERSFLLDGHYGNSTELSENPQLIRDGKSGRMDETGPYVKPPSNVKHGAVYVVAGSSGQTSGGNLDHPAMFISLDELGSLVLDIDGIRLDAQFLRGDGAVTDHFTILKAEEFRITSFRVQPNSVTLSWRSQPGQIYYIDYKPSLSAETWTPVSGGIPAQGTQATWTGLRPPGPQSGFYRVVKLVAP